MRAPTRESARERMIRIMARGSTIMVLVISIGFLVPKAAAQSDKYSKPALERARVTKQVSYHTFRHTFGTLLNANGENPKVVQELLRHASLRVTTDVCMQAVGPQKREAQSNLVKLVRRGAVSEIKPALSGSNWIMKKNIDSAEPVYFVGVPDGI